ncbi:MAG: TonB-dependent receptor [Bacteroidaceae bacterium]|nr:TonB-dependent receptor [Bacteroidaceae bacterium]
MSNAPDSYVNSGNLDTRQSLSPKTQSLLKRMYRYIPTLALSLSALCTQAQTDTLRLPAAVITERPLSAPQLAPVQQLSGKALQSFATHSVADAVRFFSGVQLKDYGGLGGLKTVNIRGMGTQHVGVVLDGVPLLNAQNGTIDLGRFAMDNLQTIALYNGQRTTLLQPAAAFASSSSIYIETQSPWQAVPDTVLQPPPTTLRIQMQGGSYATLSPSVRVQQILSPRLALTMSTAYMHSEGNYHFRYKVVGAYDTTGTRRNSDIDYWRLETALHGRTPRSQWQLRSYLYTSGRGLPGAIVRGRGTAADRQWDTNLFLQGTLRHRSSAAYTQLHTFKAAYDYLRYRTYPEQDANSMYADNRYRTASLYLSSAHLLRIRTTDVSLAADYRVERMGANLYHFATPTRHNAMLSLAAQQALGPVALQANLLGTWLYDHTRRGTSMPARTALSPSLHIAYQASSNAPIVLRAFFKHTFRPPTLNDLYYTLVGNSALKPERTWQYNVGATLHLPESRHVVQSTISFDAYHNRVTDKIVAIPGTSLFRWTMLNLGKVSIQGIEAQAKSTWSTHTWALHLHASYTYERARDITQRTDPFYGDQIPYIPRHSASVIAQIQTKHFDLRYSFIYTGTRYAQRANTPDNHLPAWYTNDLAVTYHHKRWHTTLMLNNVFQQRYEVVRGYPLPGRHAMLTIAYER